MRRLLTFFIFLAGIQSADAICTASFTSAFSPAASQPLRWSFTNTSTFSGYPPFSSYTKTVNFGDGSATSSFGGTITHNYATPGTYAVKVVIKVLDSLNQMAVFCSDSTTQTITVAYAPCASSFTTSLSGNVATFSITNLGGGSNASYMWSYGDGSTGTSSTHTYTTNGNYNACLSTTVGGCTYTTCQTVTVSSNLPACANLHALFIWSTAGNIGYFSNSSTSAPGLTKTSTWNYGDGNSGTSNQHVYTATGMYNVKLKVVWSDSITQAVYCTDSVAHNLTIPVIPSTISGTATWDSLNNPGPQTIRVWLIKYDSLTTSLSAIDSLTIVSNSYVNYAFNNKPPGNYRLKAAKQYVSPASTGIIPTYHTSSLYWGTANVINHTGGNSNQKNIFMQSGVVTAGPGFIGGNVTLGANKGTGAGVPNVTVLLRDAAGAAIQFVTTDALGVYSFSNLPAGNYSVYPEMMNFQTTPWTVVITAAAPSVTDGGFLVSMNSKTVKPGVETGVSGVNAAKDFVRISPNPSNGVLHLEWNWPAGASQLSVAVCDVTGKQVSSFTKPKSAAAETDLQLQNLPKGIYHLRITSGNATQVTPFILR